MSRAIRNTPLLVQIFLVYFGLASLGLKLSRSPWRLAALTINVGAYTTEIMRAGFEAIPRGQIEAAEGLALSRLQIYWHVVLLPAIERVYPALDQPVRAADAGLVGAARRSRPRSSPRSPTTSSRTPTGAFETYIVVGVALRRAVAGDARRLLGPRPRAVPAPSPARHAAVRCAWAASQRQSPDVPRPGRAVDGRPVADRAGRRRHRRLRRRAGADLAAQVGARSPAAATSSSSRARRCWSSCSSPIFGLPHSASRSRRSRPPAPR